MFHAGVDEPTCVNNSVFITSCSSVITLHQTPSLHPPSTFSPPSLHAGCLSSGLKWNKLLWGDIIPHGWSCSPALCSFSLKLQVITSTFLICIFLSCVAVPVSFSVWIWTRTSSPPPVQDRKCCWSTAVVTIAGLSGEIRLPPQAQACPRCRRDAVSYQVGLKKPHFFQELMKFKHISQ